MFRNVTTQWAMGYDEHLGWPEHGANQSTCPTGLQRLMQFWSPVKCGRAQLVSWLSSIYVLQRWIDEFDPFSMNWKGTTTESHHIFHTGTQNPCLMFPIGIPTNPLILSLIQGSIEPSWTDENLSRLSSAWVETTNQTSLGCLEGKPTRS